MIGYEPQSLNEQLWSKAHGNFSLVLDGDNIFLYCLDSWNRIRFLFGFSNTGSWKAPFLEASEYGQHRSALPVVLMNSTATLPHKDNYYYNGKRDARISMSRRTTRDPVLWVGSDDMRFSIGMGIHQAQVPDSSSLSPSGMFPSIIVIAILVIGCFCA